MKVDALQETKMDQCWCETEVLRAAEILVLDFCVMTSCHVVVDNQIFGWRRWRQQNPPKCWYPTTIHHQTTRRHNPENIALNCSHLLSSNSKKKGYDITLPFCYLLPGCLMVKRLVNIRQIVLWIKEY